MKAAIFFTTVHDIHSIIDFVRTCRPHSIRMGLFMKGTKMSVARVTMVDYISEEAADEFEAVYQEICPKMLPDADALILVRTSTTSGLSIAIYKSEQLAEEMLPTRAKMIEQCPTSIKDMFHLEGSVSLHYVNELVKTSKT